MTPSTPSILSRLSSSLLAILDSCPGECRWIILGGLILIYCCRPIHAAPVAFPPSPLSGEGPGVRSSVAVSPYPQAARSDAERGAAGVRYLFTTWSDPATHELCGRGWATEWDDHVTASGIPADLDGIVGCSLPTGRCAATAGSPFPPWPYGSTVKVYNPLTGKAIHAPLIDEGPAFCAEAGTGCAGSAMIDLTPAAVRALRMTDNTVVTIRLLRSSVAYASDILHALRAMYFDAIND